MNSFHEVIIVDDLIEGMIFSHKNSKDVKKIKYFIADSETMSSNSNALWTEQALDLFISQLQNTAKHIFTNEHEMLAVVARRMSSRNFRFSLEQIEKKYNELKQMYKEKKQRNQEIEPLVITSFF